MVPQTLCGWLTVFILASLQMCSVHQRGKSKVQKSPNRCGHLPGSRLGVAVPAGVWASRCPRGGSAPSPLLQLVSRVLRREAAKACTLACVSSADHRAVSVVIVACLSGAGVPHRESICDDLDGAVIEALHSRDVEVAESCVHGDTCTSFPAHPRSCLFQWYPSASQHPRPRTGRSVVAKWVKIATAPTSSFGKG